MNRAIAWIHEARDKIMEGASPIKTHLTDPLVRWPLDHIPRDDDPDYKALLNLWLKPDPNN